ncbi:hypothetical protein GPAL_2700 [Glaciecola pallidula DSM 14239 = ACAM 615]|uniref:Uncharacterized protein n=1 Tax=Brumicola pallidula DSM 14239 = ACAM 615 TaxID=1121922 RepID=K6Z007_9ALTE|nr:hypothetical protein GPAL_2700 [Glaciecola pallidula DSM 14239 = ACAM 615]
MKLNYLKIARLIFIYWVSKQLASSVKFAPFNGIVNLSN